MITTDATALLLLAILLGVALIGTGCLAAYLVLAARRRRRPPADRPVSPPEPPPTSVVLRAAGTAPRQSRPARPISGASPRALLVTERITAHQLLTGEIDQATYRARMRELAMRAEAASQR